MTSPIYLDNAATTPLDPRVAAVMLEFLMAAELQGNPASATHGYGLAAQARVAAARAQVAALIGANPDEIVFTSGATEANNLALLGVAQAARRARRRGHFVSARTEHKSVLDALKQLERDEFTVTLLEPDEWGRVPPEAVRTALRADTLLVSIMHANNEVGCVNDIAAIAEVCRERDVLMHTDASQSAGKWRFGVDLMRVDFLSLTAHKMHGPKGIGALYVREAARPRLAPVMLGGGHERGLRSGTLASHQVAGFGAAAALAAREGVDDARLANDLRRRLMEGLAAMPGVELNTLTGAAALPGIVNASFGGVEGESLVTGLAEIAVSTGSACSSATREPSYVLRALGRDAELAQSSLRLSLGRFSTAADVDGALAALRREVTRLRLLAGGEGVPEVAEAGPSPVPGMSLLAQSLTPLAQRYFLAPARRPRFPAGESPAGFRHGRAGRPSDGTAILFELEIADEFVRNARFSAYGCPHTLAVTSWLCEVLEGRPLAAGPPGGPADWAAKFAVPTEKLGRLLIVEDALRAAYP